MPFKNELNNCTQIVLQSVRKNIIMSQNTLNMHQIEVSLVYATREKQWIYQTRVARGTSAEELIKNSGFNQEIDDLVSQAIEELTIGVYAQKVAHDYLLQDGDRVEIYRPLTADPKEVRRQLALLGKTMGNV